MNEYSRRNLILLEMGFKDYKAYLRSKLWIEIRTKKLVQDKNCFGCDRPAKQVHHGRYTRENLAGDTQRDMYSICMGCHLKIEFTRGGYKRTPRRATMELLRMRKHRMAFKSFRVDRRIHVPSKPFRF